MRPLSTSPSQQSKAEQSSAEQRSAKHNARYRLLKDDALCAYAANRFVRVRQQTLVLRALRSHPTTGQVRSGQVRSEVTSGYLLSQRFDLSHEFGLHCLEVLRLFVCFEVRLIIQLQNTTATTARVSQSVSTPACVVLGMSEHE
jgi:hypothetical protein